MAAGLPGVNLRMEDQHGFLKMADIYPEFNWNEQGCPKRRFYLGQGWFKHADSICLYSMLRLVPTERVIEVG